MARETRIFDATRSDIRTGGARGCTCDTNDAVAFSIHDSGPGIADENLGRIFDSFFTTKDAGVGIGLAICQSIMVAHGGGITASNHPDGGAVFRFWLPAQASTRRTFSPLTQA